MVVILASAFLLGQLPAKPVILAGAFDQSYKPAKINLSKGKATLLFFISTDCPIANRYAPEIRRIATQYSKRDVATYRVYVAGKEKVKETIMHGKDFKLNFPILLDPNKKLVAATGATVTPEACLISPKGMIVYRGRIDNQNIEHGSIRKDYRRDLRIALDEFLAGKPVTISATSPIGCFL